MNSAEEQNGALVGAVSQGGRAGLSGALIVVKCAAAKLAIVYS